MWRKICRAQGSYTIEAVFLFPVIIFLLAFLLHLSIDWYEGVTQETEKAETLRQLETEKYFLDIDGLNAIKDLLVP